MTGDGVKSLIPVVPVNAPCAFGFSFDALTVTTYLVLGYMLFKIVLEKDPFGP